MWDAFAPQRTQSLMSLKSLLMPIVAARLLSRERLLAKRSRAERKRKRRGEPHRIHYFHQVDDPYSTLATAALPRLLARYDVELVPHLTGPPPDDAAPQQAMLVTHSRRDAAQLAEHVGLELADPGAQPAAESVRQATALLAEAIETGRFVDEAWAISRRLWSEPEALAATTSGADQRAETSVRRGTALRARLGHYLGATFHYGGEWYWGLDRLYHLEQRLQELGAARSGVDDLLFPPSKDLRTPTPLEPAPEIDFFFSLRSPYSAIVTPRIFELARLTGAKLRLRFVLPMVMRGLPVPRAKRRYIAEDAAREAFARGIPFGRVNDPVGRPVERGLSLMPLAERVGRGEDYLASFMRGVWAEGIDAGSDRGLRTLAERAGLEWRAALGALGDDGWRATAEANRQELFGLGHWGVPCFRIGETLVMGQDRLWAVGSLLGVGPGSARSHTVG